MPASPPPADDWTRGSDRGARGPARQSRQDRVDRPERPARGERPDRRDRRPERPDQRDRRPERPGRPDRWDRRAEHDDQREPHGVAVDDANADYGGDDRADDGSAPARVRRVLSLGMAGFAVLVALGLIVGAQTTRSSYAVVIFGVQLLFVVAWTVASRPPAPRVVAAVGIATAIGTDIAAVEQHHPASLAPLAYVTAGGFIAGVIGQLSRPAGRVRVTESLGSSLVVSLGAVAFAALIVLSRTSSGTQALVGCVAAAGAAIAVARLTDILAPIPRISPQVPRGGVGVVFGSMVGTATAGVVGNYLVGIPTLQTALAGLVTAVVAVMVDLSIGYAEAGRHVNGDAPALWIARHLQGPLAAFAFAAPVMYGASALLLLRG